MKDILHLWSRHILRSPEQSPPIGPCTHTRTPKPKSFDQHVNVGMAEVKMFLQTLPLGPPIQTLPNAPHYSRDAQRAAAADSHADRKTWTGQNIQGPVSISISISIFPEIWLLAPAEEIYHITVVKKRRKKKKKQGAYGNFRYINLFGCWWTNQMSDRAIAS